MPDKSQSALLHQLNHPVDQPRKQLRLVTTEMSVRVCQPFQPDWKLHVTTAHYILDLEVPYCSVGTIPATLWSVLNPPAPTPTLSSPSTLLLLFVIIVLDGSTPPIPPPLDPLPIYPIAPPLLPCSNPMFGFLISGVLVIDVFIQDDRPRDYSILF
ncbi:hypothetical protein AX774_g4688 [Zancudomyces culisetae]|uniref:Uncharacterized protein n=1 Tax=Zancudomyces culisetae TaxID=1213189 RepID=A0A1R1PLP1_ZANCU|nr:hypothetical protein AX774_g6049 [Zancudomyces culisetae]OMH81849.1 hypothetical protein AX774_g4688 [Zancudomyces culisetae]|eukprot:OMH80503.1 hypothetical protein AX774_g6049 [Zancudomyces culisetae]